MSQDTFKTLSDLLIDVFEVDDLVLTHATAAADVPGWDSLGNIRLFLSIEQEFGIRFTAGEIGGIKNLGELAEAIDAKS
jgi:acyl carrier protein